MAFSEVDASKRVTTRGGTSPEMAYYGKTAQFRLNGAAMAKLQEANGGNAVDRVVVLHDSERNLLGVAPAAADAANAAKLSADSPDAPSRYFGFRGLAIKAGLPDNIRWTLPFTFSEADGIHVVNLANRNDIAITPRQAAAEGEDSEGDGEAEATEAAPADEARASRGKAA